MDRIEVGVFLKTRREALLLSISKLSETTGISRAIIYSIENGTSAYTVDYLLRYCDAVACPLFGHLK